MVRVIEYVDNERMEYELDGVQQEPYANWHEPERAIRVVLTHDVRVMLVALKDEHGILGTQPEVDGIIGYIQSLDAPKHTDGTTTYIYLEELYPEHQVLLEKYGVGVETKSNYSK